MFSTSPGHTEPDPASDEAIGSRLAIIRVGLGMTQAKFAQTIGVSPRSYFHYEKGTRSLTADKLRRLREVHQLNLHWVLFGEGLPLEGHNAEAVAEFAAELSAYLKSTQTVLPVSAHQKIIARWQTALRNGQRLEIPEVAHWVDLMRE